MNSYRYPMMFIAWSKQLDHALMFARRFNAQMVHVYSMPLESNPRWLLPLRYLIEWVIAWNALFGNRPRFVYVVNPPVLAALNVWVYCLLTGARFMMDTHSPALYSKDWGWSLPLQRFLSKRAVVNIVDQQRFQTMFESWGAHALVLSKPPGVPVQNMADCQADAQDCCSVMVVNTFGPDEPVQPVLDAARSLPDVHFYVTGDIRLGDPAVLATAPENVIFTGFLLREAYWQRMNACRAVMVLTTYPYSLLGGAQDGLVMCKPLIVSNQPSLTDYFTKGTVFVDNTPESITSGIHAFRQQEERLCREIQILADEKHRLWQANFAELQCLVDEQGHLPNYAS